MIKSINNFYQKTIVLAVCFLGALAGWISWSIVTFSNNQIKLGIFAIIFAAITFSLFLSYLKGETSIQKLLFGSLFLFLIVDVIEILFVYIENYSVFGPAYVTMCSLILLLTVLMFVCHILQQSDHIGKSVSIIIGEIAGLIAILWVAFAIVMVCKNMISASDITFVLAFIFTIGMLICMETKIAAYKQLRSEKMKQNAWDDKARAEAKKIFKI